MSSSDNKKSRGPVRQITNTELMLYGAMVVLTAISQFVMHNGKSLAETLAWIIVYAFILGVVFFGWARRRAEAPSKSEK